MQPYFFPYIGYWQLIKSADIFVLLDDVNFINRGWINRNRILVKGEPHMLTLPLIQASQNRKICEIAIQRDRIKLNKILKTLSDAYARLPGRELVIELAEQFANFDGLLADALYISIQRVCGLLAIPTRILRSSQLKTGKELTGCERIMGIARDLGGDTYINPPGGRDLYSHSIFQEAGLSLKFLQPGFTPYPQKSATFIPALSILDMLASGIQTSSCMDNYRLED